MSNTRFPYTYACDFIRAIPDPSKTGTILSRSDAALIINNVAEVLGMTHEELAIKLAEAEQAKTPREIEDQAMRIIRALGLRGEG